MLFAATLALPAQAQTTAAAQRARLRLGPFRMNPRLVLRELGLDSNVFHTFENPQRDFVLVAGPHLDITTGQSRLQFGGLATAEYVYYNRFASERSYNGSFKGGVTWRASRRLTLFADPSWVNARERPSLELDARARRHEFGLQIGGRASLFRRIELEVVARENRARFDRDERYFGVNLAKTLNNTHRALLGSVRYSPTRITSFVADAEAATDRFPDVLERDRDTARFRAGADFKPRGLLSGGFRVGFLRTEAINEARLDFSGPTAEGDITATVGLTAVRVNFVRDLRNSYLESAPDFVNTAYGANIRRQLSDRFDVSFGAQISNHRYRTVPARPDSELSTVSAGARNRVRAYDAVLGYVIGRNTRMTVNASYSTRNAALVVFPNYEAFRVGAGLTYGF